MQARKLKKFLDINQSLGMQAGMQPCSEHTNLSAGEDNPERTNDTAGLKCRRIYLNGRSQSSSIVKNYM